MMFSKAAVFSSCLSRSLLTRTNVASNSLGFSTSARMSRVRQQVRQQRLKPTYNQADASSKIGLAAISTGRIVVAASGVTGLAALCYYGIYRPNNTITAIDKMAVWPDYVRQRVRDTYMYFGASIAATGASAYAVSRNATLMRLASRSTMPAVILSMAAIMATNMLCQSIEYTPGFGNKQMAWMLHTAVIGAMIAPLSVLGGALLVRAASYTAGIAGGISLVAVSAPSEQFLSWGAPLGAGLGVMILASIGSAFLPPTTAVGMTLHSVVMYGGLVLFSAMLLYKTQKAMHRAENHPAPQPWSRAPLYDPVNMSMGLYMSVVNIFVRMATMMAGGNKRR